MTLPSEKPNKVDTSTAHSARIWNFWLGGKDNYPVDRELGERIVEVMPDLPRSAQADRAFLGRVVTHLTGEVGISQFLDIGTGLPTANSTHQVAQRINPAARVVYVDNDPLVLAHAAALLTGTPQGATDYIEADLRHPDSIIDQAARTLDFLRPVGLMLLGILNFITDDNNAGDILRRLMDALPTGSHLAISHPTTELDYDAAMRGLAMWNTSGSAPMCMRSRSTMIDLVTRAGLELMPPGIVSCTHWPTPDSEPAVDHFGGLAQKQ